MPLTVYKLRQWVDRHRDLLKRPIGNKMMFQDGEFLVMIVGGPNARKDYHIEDGEEFSTRSRGTSSSR